MSEQGKGDNALSAFILGGILGAVAALFLAPRSGRDTRRRVSQWLEDLEEKGEDLLQEGRDLLEEGRDAFQGKADRLKRVIDGGRKAWGDEHSKQ